MKLLWIFLVRSYIRLGLFFYYKRIKVLGKSNIPKKGAVLFVSNHQNALIDPLIIGTTNNRNTHFLTRAGVFKKKLIIKFFNSVQMIPIYRIRDGRNELSKNEAIFNKCNTILHHKKALLIFPEGGHNLARRVRPLSKGFTRILFGTFQKHPELTIQVVPVGLNYNSILNHPASCTVIYGEPICANDYWDKDNLYTSTNQLKEVVRNRMKLLTTHIENTESYDAILLKLEMDQVDFLNPQKVNEYISRLDQVTLGTETKPTYKRSFIYYLFIINSCIPWLLWRKTLEKIKEVEFVSTFRFAFGITLFPLFYILQSYLIKILFNNNSASIYLICSILLGLLVTKLTKDKLDNFL